MCGNAFALHRLMQGIPYRKKKDDSSFCLRNVHHLPQACRSFLPHIVAWKISKEHIESSRCYHHACSPNSAFLVKNSHILIPTALPCCALLRFPLSTHQHSKADAATPACRKTSPGILHRPSLARKCVRVLLCVVLVHVFSLDGSHLMHRLGFGNCNDITDDNFKYHITMVKPCFGSQVLVEPDTSASPFRRALRSRVR